MPHVAPIPSLIAGAPQPSDPKALLIESSVAARCGPLATQMARGSEHQGQFAVLEAPPPGTRCLS